MPSMKRPPDKDYRILTGGVSSVGAWAVPARASNPSVRGFNSLRLHFLHRGERQPSPVLQTRTTEAAESDISILRSSACPHKEGRADEPTRRTRFSAC